MEDCTAFTYTVHPKSLEYKIHIDRWLDSPDQFREVIEALESATDKDTVTIYLNTPGGCVASTTYLLHAMSRCAAHIHCIGGGRIASCGTYILLMCDSFELDPFTLLLFHSHTHGYFGKIKDTHSHAVFAMESMKYIHKELYSPYLTEEEINQINDGRELYMTAEEFCKRFEAAQKKAVEEAQD